MAQNGGPPVFAQAQEQPAPAAPAGEGAQQFADLGDFKLLSGAIIRNCRVTVSLSAPSGMLCRPATTRR